MNTMAGFPDRKIEAVPFFYGEQRQEWVNDVVHDDEKAIAVNVAVRADKKFNRQQSMMRNKYVLVEGLQDLV